MKLVKYLAAVVVTLSLFSCEKDFLNQVPEDRITIEQVFQRRKYSEEYLANIYNYIPNEAYRNRTIWEGASDDADITYDRPNDGYDSYPMNLGKWNAASNYYNKWNTYYNGIRSATYFIQNIGKNAEILALNNASSNKGTELINQYRNEARFLRAYFYYNLLRQYGPFIIVGDEPLSGDLQPSDPESNLPRNTFDECVDYIVSEMEAAKVGLPKHFTDQRAQDKLTEFGRITQAICDAYISKTLLIAASPQFNGNPDYAGFTNKDGKQLISAQYDPNKWKKAADAAKRVITDYNFELYKKYNANGTLDPFLSCRDVFLDPWNSEVIFCRTSNNLKDWERSVNPRTASGYAAVGVTQQLVDEFEMNNGQRPILGYNTNGSPIVNAASGYSETGFTNFRAPGASAASSTFNMYVNREPRFYVNVTYNGSEWSNSDGVRTVELHFTGTSGKKGSWDFPRTGYIARKNVSPNSNPRTAVYSARPFVITRYAEILLNYVEALNEYDPGNPDILTYLNQIRNRAGLPNATSGTQEQMREKIRHERRVELALEGLRYTDTRRWLIAEQTDGGPFYGMNVDAGTRVSDLVFYQRTVFERRVFRKNYYLFPIPQSEIDRNQNMVQNPGW